jgi:hypothetical protein
LIRRRPPHLLATALAAAALTATSAASANERHFAFAYETATLPAGNAEFEPGLTTRLGRPDSFTSLEYRFEFEVGVTDRLQLAIYANGDATAEGINGPGTMRTTHAGFTSSSLEVKYRLLDPVADPIGLALYGEMTGGPDGFELESKVILDRRFGRGLFAANLVYDHEWNLQPNGSVEDENEVILYLAGGYFVTDQLVVGLEAREHNIFTPMAFETATIYAGPSIAYASNHWWVALAVTPQIAALWGAAPNDIRTFHDHEALDARLVLGLHF